MLVSIIVPVFNVKTFLPECLDSILMQSYNDFEVLLIDDGSDDGSSEICDKYVTMDARLKVFHNKNHGVSYSRNFGLSKAKGEYISFIDSDDYVADNYLEEMVMKMQLNNVDIVMCNYAYVKKNNIDFPFEYMNNKHLNRREICTGIFIDNSIGGFVWNKLFKKSVINGKKFSEDLDICEDTYFVLNVLNANISVYYLSEILYYYRIRNNSAINNLNNLFDYNYDLKYGVVFDRIMDNKLITVDEEKIMNAGLCILATDLKCDYSISDGKDRKIYKALNSRIDKNIKYLIKSHDVSLNKKIIVMLNRIFNLRRIKYHFKTRIKYRK